MHLYSEATAKPSSLNQLHPKRVHLVLRLDGMPEYVPSKKEQFEDLLNKLFLRLGAPVDGMNQEIDSLNLSDEDIYTVLLLLIIPLFMKKDFRQNEIDILNEIGATLDKLDGVYEPLHEFIRTNEGIIDDLFSIYKDKIDIIHKQVRPNLPRLAYLGGKRHKVTRKRKVQRRKTRGWRSKKGN